MNEILMSPGNVDKLFTFHYDPLKIVLVDIVRNLQEHKEMLLKINSERFMDDFIG
jgi:hypothetical protein